MGACGVACLEVHGALNRQGQWIRRQGVAPFQGDAHTHRVQQVCPFVKAPCIYPKLLSWQAVVWRCCLLVQTGHPPVS